MCLGRSQRITLKREVKKKGQRGWDLAAVQGMASSKIGQMATALDTLVPSFNKGARPGTSKRACQESHRTQPLWETKQYHKALRFIRLSPGNIFLHKKMIWYLCTPLSIFLAKGETKDLCYFLSLYLSPKEPSKKCKSLTSSPLIFTSIYLMCFYSTFFLHKTMSTHLLYMYYILKTWIYKNLHKTN